MRARPAALLLALLALASSWAAAAPALLLPPQGPDVPAATAPVATVAAFTNEVYSGTEGVRSAVITVPSVSWNRVVVVFSGQPGGDPWDRFFGVGIGGAEVLRGTTPRTDFTVRKDVTEFAGLLPAGGAATVQVFYGSYEGAPSVSVRLEFYDDPSAALVAPPADHVVRPFAWRYFGGHGSTILQPTAFPADPPSSASVELFLTGHGEAEFWFQHGLPVPRLFTVYVDNASIGTVRALPYAYAFLGFRGGSIYNDVVHKAMWWSAHQALDVAGVHTGVGEIPPFRAEVPAEYLPLLTGARDVKVVQTGQTGYWITSLNFVLNE